MPFTSSSTSLGGLDIVTTPSDAIVDGSVDCDRVTSNRSVCTSWNEPSKPSESGWSVSNFVPSHGASELIVVSLGPASSDTVRMPPKSTTSWDDLLSGTPAAARTVATSPIGVVPAGVAEIVTAASSTIAPAGMARFCVTSVALATVGGGARWMKSTAR